MVIVPLIPKDIDVVFIVGPTASGKSDFALLLAEKNNGIIINSDALQIYKQLSLLTARPQLHEMQRVPHYLFGHIDINHEYNVAHWCKEAQEIIQKYQSSGKKIIIVGGTGLYTHSLIHGIATIPEIPIFIRKIARSMTNKELYDELSLRDPIAYQKLHLNDTQRLSRAYEVVYATGKSIYEFHHTTQSLLPPTTKHMGFFLNPQREELYHRIDQRFLKMIEHGAIQEVKKIKDYDKNLQAMKAVGVSELSLYLDGNISLEEAISQAQQSSRNYAKRQVTWFKNRFKDFTIIE